MLKPTSHPRLPGDLSQLWLAPIAPARTAALNEFVSGVKLEVDSNFARALPIFMQPSVRQGTLGHYAEYYQGLAELRLGRAADARQTFRALAAKNPLGYLVEAAALREAECDETLGDQAAAMQVYERLSKTKTTAPDEVLMRFGRAAKAAGNPEKATEAYSRLVYEFPFSDLAPLASAELESLPIAPIAAGTNRYKLELGRAERLFGAKRYAQARAAFEGLRQAARDDDREIVQLRLAECDYFLKRPRNARDGVKPYLDKRRAAGRSALLLRRRDARARRPRRIPPHRPPYRRRVPDAELGGRSAQQPRDALHPAERRRERGAHVPRDVREVSDRALRGTRGVEDRLVGVPQRPIRRDRARVRVRGRAFPAVRLSSAVALLVGPRARGAERGGAGRGALHAGRDRLSEQLLRPSREQAPRHLASAGAAVRPARRRSEFGMPIIAALPLPPNEPVVRALLGLELYDQALDELHYAQKVWGDSSAIQATIGWIYYRRGDLRAGINVMKRAYPQYLAAGGEKLPTELLKVLFPVNYWPLIRRYSIEHQLDPYVIAALIAQESTFTADVKSAANAYGLMQLLPSTGRQYAKRCACRASRSAC